MLRSLGLVDARPSASELTMAMPAALVRAGRAVDMLLSKTAAAQTNRIVGAYADALRSQGATGWREMLRAWRIYVGMSLMTAEGATTENVARVLGYRSPVPFCHAFANAGMPSPGLLRDAIRSVT